ncbi:MAG: FecR family protein [bacterium]
MKTLGITRLLALAFLVCVMVQVSFAGNERPGNIRVLDVSGDVSFSPTTGGAPQPLGKGVFVHQGQIIKTGKGAKALLLMSNGTQLSVDQNTTFHVVKFLQTPFDSSKVSFRDLKAEPSTSQTRISVTQGSIIADVAKLAKGSTFKIGTPAGDASIHGTLIQVTVNTTAGGSVSVTINLPQGLSDFAATNGQQVTLANGQTVTVSANPVTGTLLISGVSPLNAQTIQQIQALTEQVAAQIPAQQAFEGVSGTAPEQLGTGEPQQGPDSAGALGGDQGAGDVGTAPGGGYNNPAAPSSASVPPPVAQLYKPQQPQPRRDPFPSAP